MKKLLTLAGVFLLSGIVCATVTPTNTDFVDYCTGANSTNCTFKIDGSGNVTGQNITAQGTLTTTGASSLAATGITGTLTQTGAINQAGGLVTVSSVTLNGGIGLMSRTVAIINTLLPSTTGQMVYCSDCKAAGAKGTICVSTGTAGPYSFVLSTGTICN